MAKDLKIAIITAGGLNGRRLAHIFKRLGIEYNLLTISYPLPKRMKKDSTLSYLIRKWRGKFASLKLLRDWKMRNLPDYPQKAKYLGIQNAPRMKSHLKKISYDYVFMMGGGILADDTIRLVKKGVFNAHPGILPFVRGVDAIAHSLLNGIQPGVTTHFIDAGIDTGAIIERFPLPQIDSNKLEDYVEISNFICIAALTKLSFTLKRESEIKRIPNNRDYPLYRKMKATDKLKLHDLLASGTFSLSLPQEVDLNDTEALLKELQSWWPETERF